VPGLRFDIIGVFLHGGVAETGFTETSASEEGFPGYVQNHGTKTTEK
jgi:hypothetical protein